MKMKKSRSSPFQTLPSPILLLASLRFVRLSLGSLLPHTHKASLAPRLPQNTIRILSTLAHLGSLDLTHSLRARRVHNPERLACLLYTPAIDLVLGRLLEGGDFVCRRIKRFLGAGAAWEENQPSAIRLQALDVGGQGCGG